METEKQIGEKDYLTEDKENSMDDYALKKRQRKDSFMSNVSPYLIYQTPQADNMQLENLDSPPSQKNGLNRLLAQQRKSLENADQLQKILNLKLRTQELE